MLPKQKKSCMKTYETTVKTLRNKAE